MITWRHPIDPADQWEGFNDPGMQHFAGDPIQNLAREVIQNSLDATLDPSKPVCVKFTEFDIQVSEIPGSEVLLGHLKTCLEENKNDTKAAKFFEEAVRTLESDRVKVLEISDYNTTGMKGPCVHPNPYHAYIKGRGESVKGDAGASGSFGIGKFAPFNVSKLRTIFLSTIYKDEEGQTTQLSQGKSILTSFHSSDGGIHQSTGYWGYSERFQPVVGSESLPSWISRSADTCSAGEEEAGSSIFVLGFDSRPEWERRLAHSVVQNFFQAIHSGTNKLVVRIGDTTRIAADTLDQFSEVFRAAVENDSQRDEEEDRTFRSLSYLDCLDNGNDQIVVRNSELKSLGNCEIRILLSDEGQKKVAILRRGMLITDELAGLKQFRQCRGFMAVVMCKSKKGNELLRSMEPPRHDSFSSEQLSTPEQQRIGKQALRELTSWVKEEIKRCAQAESSDITSIELLNSFFAHAADVDDTDPTLESSPTGKIIITPLPVKRPEVNLLRKGSAGEKRVARGTSRKGGGTGNPNKNRALTNNVVGDVRMARVTGDSATVFFTSSSSNQISVAVEEYGAYDSYPISIIKAINEDDGSELPLEDGMATLQSVRGGRMKLKLTFERPVNGAFRVVGNEV